MSAACCSCMALCRWFWFQRPCRCLDHPGGWVNFTRVFTPWYSMCWVYQVYHINIYIHVMNYNDVYGICSYMAIWCYMQSPDSVALQPGFPLESEPTHPWSFGCQLARAKMANLWLRIKWQIMSIDYWLLLALRVHTLDYLDSAHMCTHVIKYIYILIYLFIYLFLQMF